MSGDGRIDVHQHLLPPEYVAALTTQGMAAWAYPAFTPGGASIDSAIAMMDENRIATGIVSLSAPGLAVWDDAEASTLACKVNEAAADLVKARPDRFGMFAAVPLPDIDGSLEAIRHAYDDLQTDGVVLMANSRGVYLGDSSLDPVMDELNRRHAVIFVHPSNLPGPPADGVHPAVADFLLDTTRAAINLATNGVPRRYPNLRIILAHGGGFLPYAAHRIALTSSLMNQDLTLEQLLDDLAGFYFDLALTASPTALPSLLAFAKPGHVLFGSDWPYAAPSSVKYFADHLDAYPGLEQQERRAIDRSNALGLFSRLS